MSLVSPRALYEGRFGALHVLTCVRSACTGCPELFNNKVKNDVIDGYYKKALDSHNVGEAVYRIAIDPKPKLRQCAPLCVHSPLDCKAVYMSAVCPGRERCCKCACKWSFAVNCSKTVVHTL